MNKLTNEFLYNFWRAVALVLVWLIGLLDAPTGRRYSWKLRLLQAEHKTRK